MASKIEIIPLGRNWVIRKTKKFLWMRSVSFLSNCTSSWFDKESHVMDFCLYSTKEKAEARLNKWIDFSEVFNGR